MVSVDRNVVAVLAALLAFFCACEEGAAQDAKIAEGPEAARLAEGVQITFTLSAFDDVTVRIVDAEGKVVRNFASGVLGKNAPPPFQKNSLSQKILWDGKDDAGKPVDVTRCKVKVDVGMGAKFASAHGDDVAAVVGPTISGLAVDSKGDLYVNSSFGSRFFGIGVLHRDGSYARTVVPIDPRVPKELVDIQDALGHPYSRAGTTRGAFWRTDPEGRRIPRALNMAGYVRGTTHFALWFYGGGIALVNDDLIVASGRWFLNAKGLIPEGPKERWNPVGWSHPTPYCVDAEGSAYQVDPVGKPWASKPGYAVAKLAKYGRAFQNDFVYTGRSKLEQPTHFIGEPGVPGDDWAHFKEIHAIATDAALNLYVADAGRGAVRIYRRDGFYLDEIASVTVDGAARPFKASDLAVARTGEIYALLPGDGKKTLIKLRSRNLPEVLWSKDLHKDASSIAVNDRADPRIVWVGNAAGSCTITRIEDQGERIGEVRTVGGKPVDALRLPGAAGIDASGNGYVLDFVDGNVVRITPDGKVRKLLSVGASRPISTMTVDAWRGYLYVVPTRWGRQGAHLLRFTLDGKQAPFAGGSHRLSLRGNLIRGLAVARNGDLFVSGETCLRLSQLKVAGKAPGPFYVVRNQSDWGYSWAHVDIYDPEGKPRKTDHVIPICTGGVAVDSEGSVYTADTDICHAWSFLESTGATGHTVKYGPEGGGRQGQECKLNRYSQGIADRIKAATPDFARNLPMPGGMLWDKPVGNPRFPAGCGCGTSYLAVDECDRVYVPETLTFQLVVLDRGGNEMTRIGTYGNRDCAGPASAIPKPEIAFMSITGVAARNDHVWVSDIGNSRALRLVVTYSESKRVDIE